MEGTRPQHGQGREALLSAVIQVAAAKGLRGVTFRAVAEAAGVNNTLIAHHFGTRDALLEAALEWSVDQSIDVTSLAQYGHDARAFREDLVKGLLANSELQVFQFEMILEASRQPHLQPAIHRLYGRYVDEFSRGRRAYGAPGGDALNRALFASLDGLVFQYLNHAISREDFIDSVDALGEFIMTESETA